MSLFAALVIMVLGQISPVQPHEMPSQQQLLPSWKSGWTIEPKCGNLTTGLCCSGEDPAKGRITSFDCKNATVCCAACLNYSACTSWTLNANGNIKVCTLRSSCAEYHRGNCTRGTVAPPMPPACANAVSAPCCNTSGILDSFVGNISIADCCQKCRNRAGCTVWNSNSTGGCVLHSTCNNPPSPFKNCTVGRLSPPAPSPPSPGPKPPGLGFNFVGTWRGFHGKDANTNFSLAVGEEVGDCTCSLIAPEWIITAEHCAERMLKHEKIHVRVNFHGDNPHVERGVTHCIRADGVDIAICHLTVAVHAFSAVWVNPEIYRTGHPKTFVYTVGTKGGLHKVRKELEYESSGAHLYVSRGGGMKAGDSGGPWVQEAEGTYFLVGVLHGSGIAGQTSHIRAFLNSHIDGIQWVQP